MNLIRFAIADRRYAVDISQAEEVIRIGTITPLPDSMDCLRGVINLRGRVIPLISLREVLGCEEAEVDSAGRIIIGHVSGNLVGVLVDSVKDVVSLEDGYVEPPDALMEGAGYLVGVGKVEGDLIPILDIEKLLTGARRIDMAEVERVSLKAAAG